MVALLMLAASFQASATRIDININAQGADKALVEFARQAGLSVLFPTERISQITTHTVRGKYEVQEALGVLLRGTGLTAELSAPGMLTVKIADESGSSDMQQPKPKKWLPALITSIAAVFTAHPGVAQEISSQSTALEEIIVTARRRAEEVQQVPISIQVLSQQALQDNNVQTLNDLIYLVPSLSGTTPIPNAIRLNLRGQGAAGNQSWPGVIMFLNEVPVPTFGGGAVSTGPGMFFDLENVQVLKGPQGTLFGKNSVGGDILLQTARPTNDTGGRVQVSYGNYNDREVDGAFNLPIISDVLLARVAFNSQLRDGYTTLLGEPSYPNGIDADNRDSWSMRATVSFRPTDWLQNDTIWTNSQYTSRGTYGVLVELVPGGAIQTTYPQVTALFAQQQALGVRTAIPISADDVANGFTHSITNITSATLPWNITVKNILGYYEENQVFGGDQDNTALPFFDVYSSPRDQTIRQITDELQVSGKSFAEHLDWIVGGFYQHQPFPNQTLEATNVFGSPSFDLDRHAEQSKAVYLQGTYDLSPLLPGLRFTAGARLSQDSFSSSKSDGIGPTCTGPIGDCPIKPPHNTSGVSHALTWTAGLDYRLSPTTLLYLTSRKGYRPGGDNGLNLITKQELPTFGPEYVQDLELGVKSDWRIAGIPIRTNADIWGQNYKNIQEPTLIAQGNTPTLNAGAAKLWGAELEVLAELSANWEIGLTYDHGAIRYTSFLPGVSASTIAGLQATRTLDFPPNKYGIRGRYRLPLPSDAGDLSLRATWNWQATSGDVSVPNGFGLKHAFGLFNMTADWNSLYGKPFDVSLFVSNAFNKVYATQAVPSFEPLYFGYGNEIYGEPRMYGIRVRYRFGAEGK